MKTTPAKQDYLKKCQEFSQQHFKNNKMFVVYLRRRQPRFHTKPTPEQTDAIKVLLQTFPNMSEKSYLAHVNSLTEQQREERNLPLDINVFRTVRSVARANSSPLIGVIVGFIKDGATVIGWSLCNRNDSFNGYDGIRRAIERAEKIETMEAKIFGQHSESLPHTIVAAMPKVIERAKRHLSDQKLLAKSVSQPSA